MTFRNRADATQVEASHSYFSSVVSAMKRAKEASRHRSDWANKLDKRPTRNHQRGLLGFLHREGKLMLLLVMLGVSASIVDYFIDTAVLGLGLARQQLMQVGSLGDSSYTVFAAWSAFTILVATAGVVWTHVFDPVAAGSGIPEMKSIISYERREDADRYLRARTLLSKIGGLTFAMGSGISVGKEGPFVHMSSIIAHRLMKHIGWCRRIYSSDILRRHMYDAACAVGVASTFRAPVGGVLFAIEATSTIFMVSQDYWRAFVAATSASLARQAISIIRETEIATYHPLFPTVFPVRSFAYVEIVAFALLAIFTGLLGVAYGSVSMAFKRRWKSWTADKPVILTAWLLLFPLTVTLSIPVGLGRLSFWDIITDLTSPSPTLPERWHADLSLSVFAVLPLAGFIRLVATTLSTSLPLPVGDFIPMFVAGATFGRLFGEVMQLCFPSSGIVPGGYALVGGAGFIAAVTHTASVAEPNASSNHFLRVLAVASVIVLEFTGQFVFTIPLLLSTLIASGVGCTLGVSVYDSVIVKKGFDCLPTLDLEDVTARDVMLLQFPLVTLDMTRVELQHVLETAPTRTLPLVDDLESRIFYGCVHRSIIKNAIRLFPNDDHRLVQLLAALQTPRPTTDAVSIMIDEPAKEDESRGSITTTEDSQSECSSESLDDNPVSRPGAVATIQANKQPEGAGRSVDDDLAATDTVRCGTSAQDEAASSTRDPIRWSLAIDSTVLQVDPDASLQKVHLLFEVIKCPRIWVTRRGQLVGLLNRRHLHAWVAELKRKDAVA
ncbi:hypothetical protein BBJ28_00020217 [Nothophytophthora sp. Chile5]|nr:hypothetical protein BBJ28_00020217 [Nothophytophthora sp. Chile5]